MHPFIAGATCLAYLVAALFFLRFWRETADRLFLLFAIAFAVLGGNRILLTFVQEPHEGHTLLYLVRLFAYLLILTAIVDKNRSGRR